MYNHADPSILLPYQRTILTEFFASPLSQTFFLTGGTALAAYYFAHRKSKDFDLFSMEAFDMMAVEGLFREIAQKLGAELSVKVAAQTYRELYLTHREEGWVQRVDIVREQSKHFGDIVIVDGVRVDALENIGSNKLLTLFGRFEPKDYVDFYTIVTQPPFTFDALFALAKQKDLGLTEFYFAQSITQVDAIVSWPATRLPYDIKRMIQYYQSLSRDLLLSIKPKEEGE